MRVVEAAGYVSGPFAGLLLADLGAEVHKVEPPGGDPYRRFGPQDDLGGVMFRTINHDKINHLLDLKTVEGVRELYALLGQADVLISNWRPGAAESLGLTAEEVERRWPELVWVRVSGYGQDGPLADAPVFDSIIQARTGTIDAVSGKSAPTLVPMFLADKVAALFAAQAALVGLSRRSSTGRGAVVDVAMLDSMAYFNGPDLLAGYQWEGRTDPRVTRQLSALRVLQTRDGAIVVSPVSGQQLKRTLEVAGLTHMTGQLKSAPDSITRTEMFYAALEGRVSQETTEYWIRQLSGADVPAAAVATMDQHLGDPQVAHNRIYSYSASDGVPRTRRVRHPAIFDGRIAGPDTSASDRGR